METSCLVVQLGTNPKNRTGQRETGAIESNRTPHLKGPRRVINEMNKKNILNYITYTL